MTYMERVRESQHRFRDQVRANALEEGGLQPVAFLFGRDTVAPVVMAEAMGPEEIFSATDQLAREMGADAAILAFELLGRRTDTPEAFREIVEEGAMRPPSESEDRKPAILWHRFADGQTETELDIYENGQWHSHGTRRIERSPVKYFRNDPPRRKDLSVKQARQAFTLAGPETSAGVDTSAHEGRQDGS